MINIYVDVDGVINAFPAPAYFTKFPEWGWESDGEETYAEGYQIYYNPDLIKRLNALAENPAVSLFWLTTWEEHAPEVLSPQIGLNGTLWPVVGTEQHYSKEPALHYWWKLDAIVDHVEKTEPEHVVWIDDDLKFDPLALEWCEDNYPRVYPVSPKTNEGITKKQMTDIEDFVKEVSDGEL